jgi:hypothetical protein
LHLGEGGKTSAGTREKQEKDEPETKTNARDKRENPKPEAAGERRPSSSPASKAHVGQTNANEGRRRTGANEGREEEERIDPAVAFASERGPSCTWEIRGKEGHQHEHKKKRKNRTRGGKRGGKILARLHPALALARQQLHAGTRTGTGTHMLALAPGRCTLVARLLQHFARNHHRVSCPSSGL